MMMTRAGTFADDRYQGLMLLVFAAMMLYFDGEIIEREPVMMMICCNFVLSVCCSW